MRNLCYTVTKAKSESSEQVEFMVRVSWLMPTISPFVFAVPNGGFRSKRTAARLKAEGVRPGVPDIIVLLPRGPWHGLLIEMKRTKGGRVSDEQAELHALYSAQGYRVVVCPGANAAWMELEAYVRI